jgi:hypothetical protein
MMKKPDTVTASGIADWVYRQEVWRLAQLGHAIAERIVSGSTAIGRLLLVLALLALNGSVARPRSPGR